MSNEPKEGSVTAPQEPLKLTLEEILVAIEREAYATLVPIPARGRTTAHSWTVTDLTDQSSFKNSHDFETLSEAASFALGRPVVARDDAAELRAALAKMSDLVFTMLNAEDELSRAKGPGGSYPEDVAGYRTACRNAWEELCSLAREHDDPDALRAALAATEGQP